MARPLRIDWHEGADELYARFIAERDRERRRRLQTLWLVRRGCGLVEASRIAGVGERSLARWLGWYRQGGMAEVLRRVPGHGAHGASGRLTLEQQERLLAQVSAGAFRTYDEARGWVAAEFGVTYRYQGMYSALARRGVHPKVPRPLAAKANPAAQAAWKRGGSPQPSARRG